MGWADRIERRNGRLVIIELHENGAASEVWPERMHAVMRTTAKAVRKRESTMFSEWRASTAEHYLEGIGLCVDAGESHTVFEVVVGNVSYVIPALALIKALFRPLRAIGPFLLKANGLELVGAAAGDGTIDWHLSTLAGRYRQLTSLQQPLSWMSCFPSARNSWESVYLNALAGRISLALPEAKVDLVIRGIKKGDRVFATEVTVVSVYATEEPFPMAIAHPRTISFHGNGRVPGRKFPMRAASLPLPMAGSGWVTTDEEWAQISPLVKISSARKHSPRSILDGVLIKLGSGIPWKRVVYPMGTWNNACIAYQTWLQDGRWAKILLILRAARMKSV